jgi:glutathione S-transferase
MLTIHHLESSQSERIVWLCEELGVPYEFKRYERDPATHLAPPDYVALHPCRTAPVVSDGALTLGESGAIIDYVIARYGDGRLAVTADDPSFVDYLFWFHYANGSLMPAVMVEIIIGMMGGAQNELIASVAARAGHAFAMIDARLGEATYFAGEAFTAADIFMLFPLTTMRRFAARDLAPYPNIRAYLQRIGERPAYRRAMSKADPELSPLLD